MLSTVTAAELQFRVDTAERDRERSLLAAIRERRAGSRAAFAARAARPAVAPTARRVAGWPRPIAPQPVCAT